MRGGFWKRPVARTYAYNLDVGEHYYYPMTSYLEAERGSRGETPGALTFSERLSRKWLTGRRYEATELRDRYSRATSQARGERAANSYLEAEMAARSARATSEMRTTASRRATAMEQVSSQKKAVSSSSSTTVQSSRQESSSAQRASSRRVEDDICKKVADIRMSPWSPGQELSEAQAASARARSRILELERELDEITKKAMTTQTRAIKTAKQMAAEAYFEDEAAVASSSKKSKKVIIESGSKMVRA